MLTKAFFFTCYDCLTVFFLAASCASRGRVAGEPPTGCLLVGLFSACLWPISREFFLHGSPLAFFSSSPHLVAVALGSTCGMLSSRFLSFFEQFVAWTEIIALSLAASFGVLCALPMTTVGGAILLAFFLSALPHTFCDVVLGDVARTLTESSRLMRALLGAVVCTAFLLFFPENNGIPSHCCALFLGVLIPCLLHAIRPR